MLQCERRWEAMLLRESGGARIEERRVLCRGILLLHRRNRWCGCDLAAAAADGERPRSSGLSATTAAAAGSSSAQLKAVHAVRLADRAWSRPGRRLVSLLGG